MKREDHDLAFMLRYENIASYEDGIVRILDRRVYPNTVRFEICHSVMEGSSAFINQPDHFEIQEDVIVVGMEKP